MTETRTEKDLNSVILESILEKKGKEIKVLDLRNIEQSIADFFIICHGDSNTQVDAVADFVERQVKTEIQETIISKEGSENSQWILLDYGSVVVHIFQKEYRDFYKLEDLWADATVKLIED